MKAGTEHAKLLELMIWIDQNTSGVTLPADERSLLAIGCFDVALEHQAAIALLHSSELYGSALALLRVLTESLVRGLWLLDCASDAHLQKFKRGKLDKTFAELVTDVEAKMGTPNGVLSGFKATAWTALNGFTHTGFHQVSRRHRPGKVEGNYSEDELAKALGVAGALGLIAGGQIIYMSGQQELLPDFFERMSAYANVTP
jgi:hypothetical protein